MWVHAIPLPNQFNTQDDVENICQFCSVRRIAKRHIFNVIAYTALACTPFPCEFIATLLHSMSTFFFCRCCFSLCFLLFSNYVFDYTVWRKKKQRNALLGYPWTGPMDLVILFFCSSPLSRWLLLLLKNFRYWARVYVCCNLWFGYMPKFSSLFSLYLQAWLHINNYSV